MHSARRLRTALLALGLVAGLVAGSPGAGATSRPAPVTRAALIEKQIAALHGTRAIIRFDPAVVSRSALVTSLRVLGLRGQTLAALPMVAIEGPLPSLVEAARLPGVVAIHPDEPIRFDLNRSVPLIFEGPSKLAQYRAGGWDGRPAAGRKVNIAVVDSGVNGQHADLQRRVVRNVKFLGTGPVGIAFLPPTAIECPSRCNFDTTSGHGTHVAGTMVGDGKASAGFYTGVAPGAGLVSLGVGDGASIFYPLAGFDDLLTHPELNVVAVNNSWGRSQDDGRGRFDSTHPINVATKALHAAGIAVVFTTGNTGAGNRTGDDAGGSTCDTVPSGSSRVAGPGTCRFSVYGSAPWTISVAAGRKDRAGYGDRPGSQYLGGFSSRGDPYEQVSIDGVPVTYRPTLTAPGVNIRAARNLASAQTAVSCGSVEPPACVGPKPAYDPYYVGSSGTSMAAPHVTGAIAVIQSAALRFLRRLLSPDEVKAVLVGSASPMTEKDGWYDWPCGIDLTIVFYPPCGTSRVEDPETWPEYSGTPYEEYQVGAGYLNLAAAIRFVRDMAFVAPAPSFNPANPNEVGPPPGSEPDPEPEPEPEPSEEPTPTPSPSESPTP
ncbi:MAG: S8 family serine peptidase [Actinomycetota bacterium]